MKWQPKRSLKHSNLKISTVKDGPTLSENRKEHRNSSTSSMPIIGTTITKLTDVENTPVQDQQVSLKDFNGTFSRQQLIESLCHASSNSSSKQGESVYSAAGEDSPTLSYPHVDEPDSEGDGDETESNADSKLQLIFCISRVECLLPAFFFFFFFL